MNTPLVFPAIGALYQTLGPWAEALLRVCVGLATVPHGMRVALGFFPNTGITDRNLTMLAASLERDGYRPSWLWARGVALTHFIAGPCIALGLLTRPMTLPLLALLLLSIRVHARNGYFWTARGLEYPAMWAVALLYFTINGAGPISLDHLLIGRAF